jgi:hypothetical protein
MSEVEGYGGACAFGKENAISSKKGASRHKCKFAEGDVL